MRKLFLGIIFLSIALFIAMKISTEVQNKILFLSDGIKTGILNLNNNTLKAIQRHFNQVEQIKQLSNALMEKQQVEYLLEALKVEYDDLLASVDSPLRLNLPNLSLVRMLSFVHMNDYKKIWLEYKNNKSHQDGTIFGLVNENKVAGIAILKNHRLEGFLNGDEKCSYSVAIGNEKLQGVAKFDINRGFIVDYIPLYPKVEVGQIVQTSGNDNIFYSGIFVGVVKEVELRQGYQIAIVEPALEMATRFYWLIDIDSNNIVDYEEDTIKTPKESEVDLINLTQ